MRPSPRNDRLLLFQLTRIESSGSLTGAPLLSGRNCSIDRASIVRHTVQSRATAASTALTRLVISIGAAHNDAVAEFLVPFTALIEHVIAQPKAIEYVIVEVPSLAPALHQCPNCNIHWHPRCSVEPNAVQPPCTVRAKRRRRRKTSPVDADEWSDCGSPSSHPTLITPTPLSCMPPPGECAVPVASCDGDYLGDAAGCCLDESLVYQPFELERYTFCKAAPVQLSNSCCGSPDCDIDPGTAIEQIERILDGGGLPPPYLVRAAEAGAQVYHSP